MKKWLLVIFLIALFLRTYNLQNLPFGFHSDEARVAWNAYSILKTGKDDRGNSFALYYNTFGDYRPTGIFYFTIPSILIFGLNEFSIRLPSALIGSLTVIAIFYLAKEITNKKSVSYISALLLTFSIWHISVSRATSEVVISLFFTIIALMFLIRSLKKWSIINLSLSFIFLTISFSLYHSVRLVGPILFVICLAYFAKRITHKKTYILFLASVFILSISLIASHGGQARFNQVAITHQNNEFFKIFLNQYLQYFSGGFLIGNLPLPQRYITPGFGVLLVSELILTLTGIWATIKKRGGTLVLLLLAATPIAAALTNEDSPNLHRSLLMLPFLIILGAIGIVYLFKQNIYKKLFVILLLSCFTAEFFTFTTRYASIAKATNAQVRNSETKNLVLYLNKVHKNYEFVYVTNDPDDPYPWYGVFNHLDPADFNQFAISRKEGEWKYQNIVFTQKECPSGDYFTGKYDPPSKKNILVVDGFKCPIESKIHDGIQAKVEKQFFYPDSNVAYTVWKKPTN